MAKEAYYMAKESAQDLSNRTQTVPEEHFCASAHLRFPETSQIVMFNFKLF